MPTQSRGHGTRHDTIGPRDGEVASFPWRRYGHGLWRISAAAEKPQSADDPLDVPLAPRPGRLSGESRAAIVAPPAGCRTT